MVLPVVSEIFNLEKNILKIPVKSQLRSLKVIPFDRRRRRNLLCIGKTNNTNSDVTTSTKVLCRAVRIAETITAGRPTYIKFTQAVK